MIMTNSNMEVFTDISFSTWLRYCICNVHVINFINTRRMFIIRDTFLEVIRAMKETWKNVVNLKLSPIFKHIYENQWIAVITNT